MKNNALSAAIVALGANLGDARATMARALAALAEVGHTRVQRVSALYRTAPVDASGPDYLNAAAVVHTRLSASELLAALHVLEAAHARERPYKNAPRTLDLDLIAWEDNANNPEPTFSAIIHNPPHIIVPHPRWKMRAFVLWPVKDIVENLVSDEALKSTQNQPIERIENIGWHLL